MVFGLRCYSLLVSALVIAYEKRCGFCGEGDATSATVWISFVGVMDDEWAGAFGAPIECMPDGGAPEAKKKTTKENFIDTLHRKFKSHSEEKGNIRPGGSRRRSNDIGITSEKGSRSRSESRSSSPSKQVSRCQSFAERPHAQPLPLPGAHPSNVGRTASGISISRPASEKRVKPSLFLPLPKPGHRLNKPDAADVDGDLATASLSSDCSIDSDDPLDSRLVSPQGNDYDTGSRAAANSHSSMLHKDQSPNITRKNSGENLKQANLMFNNHQSLSSSPKRGLANTYASNISHHGAFGIGSAPDSSMSSPSRSPIRAVCPDQIANYTFWATKPYPDVSLLGSGQCSSPGSGHNSGHNSMGGDMSGQLFWQPSRGSPECSPIPSPRMTSPGPSSRIQSGAVTPLHPRAGGAASEAPASWPDDGKQQSHRLPLPPLTISSSPFSPSSSGVPTSSSVPRSPGRVENPTSPGSRWKKGKLIGRGTFGHVYVGFNRKTFWKTFLGFVDLFSDSIVLVSSASGEMCAMKEVTLFSDDAKSKESAKQLMQIDDKLYIYLEYVSGGSIHKLLQEYGQLGEAAIRSYTQQILLGLAYLHAKNTVHRDIKGANILVDPNGRVKLADFGMAKHVIKNSNGCNLAVDIWSLGCTVLEMATTKPPWSQYEGRRMSLSCVLVKAAAGPDADLEVAAMFKIGNSKELPTIPEHLSEDGKDFVRLCLQRDPQHRPTAAQLLEHRFVKNVSSVEKPFIVSQPSEAPGGVANGTTWSTGSGHGRNFSSLDMEGLAIHQLRGAKTHSSSRFPPSLIYKHKHNSEFQVCVWEMRDLEDSRHYDNFYTLPACARHFPIDLLMPRTCPVSPIGSPLLHSRSPQHMNGRMSPSPISSPRTTSGSSTPLTGGNGAIPFHHLKHGAYHHDGISSSPRSPSGSSYHDSKPDLFQAMQPGGPHAFRELMAAESDILGKSFGRPGHGGDLRELYDGQSILADRVSQQLLRDNVKYPTLDLISSASPMLGRATVHSRLSSAKVGLVEYSALTPFTDFGHENLYLVMVLDVICELEYFTYAGGPTSNGAHQIHQFLTATKFQQFLAVGEMYSVTKSITKEDNKKKKRPMSLYRCWKTGLTVQNSCDGDSSNTCQGCTVLARDFRFYQPSFYSSVVFDYKSRNATYRIFGLRRVGPRNSFTTSGPFNGTICRLHFQLRSKFRLQTTV
ncbi:hypothetical protein ACLOJK_024438 [Asimina triloba]